MDTVLIVDDEKNYPLVISAVLEDAGFEALTANSGLEALDILNHADIDLVLTDMKMPGMDGIHLLDCIKEKSADLPVIMMTAYGTVEKAVEAMQKGAHNYILKPFDNENLIVHAKKAVEMYRMASENRRLRDTVESQYSFDNIIGKSKAMHTVFETIRKIAPSSATVLIEGENGTGKELAARAVHFNSPRKEKPFIAVNCSALSENLLESELFGHEKGAFTNAIAMKKGRFELADGGTLFLDEIGELSTALQIKLLRVLQERVFERVGGSKSISVDIRIITATNRILSEAVREGEFREDLYYRLNVLHIVLPPLRERTEDIRLLVRHFMEKYADERNSDIPITGIDQAAERLLYEYSWPGNVRELENTIERAVILCPGGTIRVSDLPSSLKPNNIGHPLDLENIPATARLSDTLVEVEKAMIRRALRLADNVQTRAAKILGIGKSGLSQKIKKYDLDVNQKK